MATISSNKSTKSDLLKKTINEQNLRTLNLLAMHSNMTIKKKIILKKHNSPQKNNLQTKVTNTLNKVTNLQNKITNSQNKETDSQNKETDSQNKVTDSQNKVTKLQNKVINSQNHIANDIKQALAAKKMVPFKKSSLMKKSTPIWNVEYYPNHYKRNVQAKKIKLHPKHEYTVVATTNKRKRRIPLRANESPTSQELARHQDSSKMKGQSLSSLVQLAEDQGLDDEDFMEILTCPSPVWWEDSSEDDISLNGDSDGNTIAEHQNTNETTTNANTKKIDNKLKTDINFYKKFITKRSKLEKILGKLKHKQTPEIIVLDENEEKKTEQNPEIIVLEGSEENKTDIRNPHIIKIKKQSNNIVEHNFNGFKENEKASAINNEFRKRKYKLGGLSDISYIEDEFLNSLESVQLPVKKINEGVNTNKIVLMGHRNKPMKNNGNNPNNVGVKKKRTRKQKLELKKEMFTDNRKNEVPIDELTNQNELMIPTDLPPLTKNPFKNTAKAHESPKSTDGNNSETVIEFDSISDTNIKFLDEYVDSNKDTAEAVSVKKYGEGKDGETVTVYQILTNKTDCETNDELDIEEQIKVNLVNKSPQTITDYSKHNGEINSFYKTRKCAHRNKSKYKKK